MNGFVKLHRKILAWGWFADPPTLSVFLALLLQASYQDTSWKGAPVRRGQVITSLSKLSEQCGISIQQTRTALSHLRATGTITETATNRYRLINIEKYDLYQDAESGTGKHYGKENAGQATDSQQTEQHHRKKKEEKEEKNRVFAAHNPVTETGNGEAKRAPRFVPPSPEEVEAYCRKMGYAVDEERFCDYYRANGWKVGRNPMRDWRAAVRNWAKSGFGGGDRRGFPDGHGGYGGYNLPFL